MQDDCFQVAHGRLGDGGAGPVVSREQGPVASTEGAACRRLVTTPGLQQGRQTTHLEGIEFLPWVGIAFGRLSSCGYQHRDPKSPTLEQKAKLESCLHPGHSQMPPLLEAPPASDTCRPPPSSSVTVSGHRGVPSCLVKDPKHEIVKLKCRRTPALDQTKLTLGTQGILKIVIALR